MNRQWDAIWINATLVTCENGYGIIEQAALAVKDGKIAWIGDMAALPADLEQQVEFIHDVSGACITPGLIDCHTHLVYAGNRAYEFELRLEGVSYEEIAKKGGGIQSTVSQTRGASEEDLLQQVLIRARTMLANGVTTIEIKSGYGLDLETEIRILQVAKRIGEILPITVKKTFLGAHTFPKEFKNNPEQYVDLVCNEMLPAIAELDLADAVDVFCEGIAFNLAQTKRVFAKANELGLPVKCHSEQLSDSNSAALAAKYNALSVDHLEYLSEDGVKAIAAAGTTAVVLPGAYYYLREVKKPPIDMLRSAQVPLAIATDCNPGTSPIMSLPVIMNMACTLFRMTPEEALLGVTQNAAKALGMADSHGTLTVGKIADLAVWDIGYPAELAYYIGNQPLMQLVKEGHVIRMS